MNRSGPFTLSVDISLREFYLGIFETLTSRF
jgi:hypothetical protein